MVKEIPVVWLQGASCTGCTISLLNSASPTIKNILIDEIIPGVHINLRFQATVMAGAGEPAIEVLESTAKKRKGSMFWLLKEPFLQLRRLYMVLLENGMASQLAWKSGWKS